MHTRHTHSILHSNHPLVHLMQSVFGLHDNNQFRVHVYSTGFSDTPSSYREKVIADSHQYLDVSAWSTSEIIDRIKVDQIHICKFWLLDDLMTVIAHLAYV